MTELVPGGNLPLPDGALTVGVPGPFDLSVLVTGAGGTVSGDADFVFFNQPSAPGARLLPGAVRIDPGRLRAGATRVTVVVSAADPDVPLGRLPVPVVTVSTEGGRVLARFTPARPSRESVLLLAEIYRRGPAWKLRALGQGYADGLAGIARDFGVDVVEEPVPPRPGPAPSTAPPTASRDATDEEFGALVARERQAAGAAPARVEPRLSAAARAHAEAMARQGRLGAEGPDGTSVFQRITAAGYRYLRIEQQLVSGPRTTAAFLDYCRSGGTTRAPLGDSALTDVGIGRADDRSGDVYWTALWAGPFTAGGLERTAAEVLTLTNEARRAARLRPLAVDPRLTTAAQAYSTDMAARAFYSHTSPEGLQPWDRAAAAGARHRGIGENIACGQRTPREVVEGWMNSPGHRANILKPEFTHLGVGYAGGGPAGTYWTQLFGLA